MEGNIYKFEDCSVEIRKGIMICLYKPTEEINIETARVCVGQRLSVSEGKSYPCLFDISMVKSFTTDARNYLATDGNELVTASALIINSPVRKMAGNFFISVNKPKNPTRLFTSKELAMEWLEQFKSAT